MYIDLFEHKMKSCRFSKSSAHLSDYTYLQDNGEKVCFEKSVSSF
jgi:hypothetical protein